MSSHKDKNASWPDRIGHAEFIALMKERLPEVYAEIDNTELGLLHCEMAVLERITLHAYNENKSETKRYFEFADEVLKRAQPDVRNALDVSFIEGFVLGSPEEQRARECMPEGLKQAFDKYAEWYKELVEFHRQRHKDA